MFLARAKNVIPAGRRGMATLQEIDIRRKSVASIEKITKSMKMVSAAKFARAETALNLARSTGPASLALTEKAGVELDENAPNQLLVGISSDRGLCGGIHSGICKALRAEMAAAPDGVEHKLVLVGDRARGIMARTHADNIVVTAAGIGKKPPIFGEATEVVSELLSTGYEYDHGKIFYNHFRNAASYEVTVRAFPGVAAITDNDTLSVYDDVEADDLENYAQMSLANSIFYSQLESATAEQSSRMSAMENASKNAQDMIDSLTLLYNRSRQAVITTELIEIISGASAME